MKKDASKKGGVPARAEDEAQKTGAGQGGVPGRLNYHFSFKSENKAMIPFALVLMLLGFMFMVMMMFLGLAGAGVSALLGRPGRSREPGSFPRGESFRHGFPFNIENSGDESVIDVQATEIDNGNSQPEEK